MKRGKKKTVTPTAAAAGRPTTVNSVQQLITLVLEVDIEAHERFYDFDKSIWYRGQANSGYGLQPGVLRDPFLKARGFDEKWQTVVDRTEFALGFERQFNQAFRRRSATFVPSQTPLEDLLPWHESCPLMP